MRDLAGGTLNHLTRTEFVALARRAKRVVDMTEEE